MSTPTGSHHQHRFCSPTNHRARLIRHNIREGTCKNVLCTEDVRCEPKWRPCRKSAWHFTVQLRLQTRNCAVTCLGWTDLSLSSNTIPGNIAGPNSANMDVLRPKVLCRHTQVVDGNSPISSYVSQPLLLISVVVERYDG
jgi:hypothetical protein